MKLNYNQKKWAMTSVLLAALAFNISPPKFMRSYSVLDLAATSADKVGEINLNRKKLQVEYSEAGDQTVAKVFDPSCSDCATESYILNESIKSQISDLNDITIKVMAEKGAQESVTKEVASSVKIGDEKPIYGDGPSLSGDQEEKSGKPDGVAKLQKTIDNDCKRHSADSAKALCAVNRIKNLFRSYSSFSIDKEALTNLIREEALVPLSEVVSDIRLKSASEGMRLDTTSDYEQNYVMPAKIKEALKPLSDLMKTVKEKDKAIARQIQEDYTALFDGSFEKLKAAKENGNPDEQRVRTADIYTLLRLMVAKQTDNSGRIVDDGMAKAESFSSGLQSQIMNQLNGFYGLNGTTTAPDVISQNGQVYQRVDGVNRGGQTGVTQMQTGGVVAAPQNLPTQNGGMNIIVPNGQPQQQQQQQQVMYSQVPQQTQYAPQQVQYAQPGMQQYAQPGMPMQNNNFMAPTVPNGMNNGYNTGVAGAINMGQQNTQVGYPTNATAGAGIPGAINMGPH